jgi:hypothetical protein
MTRRMTIWRAQAHAHTRTRTRALHHFIIPLSDALHHFIAILNSANIFGDFEFRKHFWRF